MKKLFLGLMVITSLSALAADTLTGKVFLSGKSKTVTLDININKAKNAKIADKSYKIYRINEHSLSAENDKKENVEALYGEEVVAQLKEMSRDEIKNYFEISNIDELACKSPKGFLVLTTSSKTIGNCIQ